MDDENDCFILKEHIPCCCCGGNIIPHIVFSIVVTAMPYGNDIGCGVLGAVGLWVD